MPTHAKILLTPDLLVKIDPYCGKVVSDWTLQQQLRHVSAVAKSLKKHPIHTYAPYISTKNSSYLFRVLRSDINKFTAYAKKSQNNVITRSKFLDTNIEISYITSGNDLVVLRQLDGTCYNNTVGHNAFWSYYERDQPNSK